MRFRALILTLALACAASLTGCGEDQPPAGPVAVTEAPNVPPAGSMQFDFSFFDDDSSAPGRSGPDASGTPRFNFLNAVVRVAYINLAVAETFYPAAEVIELALSVEPVMNPDGSYMWVYTWRESREHVVTITLLARAESDTVVWELRVDDPQGDPILDDFLWIRGEHNEGDESGHWIFTDIEEGRTFDVARIDWTVRDSDHRELRFEALDRQSDDFGDTLSYSLAGTIASVEFYDRSEDLYSDITWDELTGAGSLRVPDYNDGERACWDENQVDVECPTPTS